jgi:Arc/MetJ-type ribon-helix-helix transcriptional regulator
MMIDLSYDLERSVRAQVTRGLFPSADELVAQAVRTFLHEPPARPATNGRGSIGAMADAADELDEIVADAMKHRREDGWRDISVDVPSGACKPFGDGPIGARCRIWPGFRRQETRRNVNTIYFDIIIGLLYFEGTPEANRGR